MKITLKNLSHIFASNIDANFIAIDNINLKMNQGEFIGIIGSTGAGKTTLIEHLNALLIPTKGEIEYEFDVEIINKKTKAKETKSIQKIVKKTLFRKIKKVNQIRKRVGVVFQFAEYQLFEETVEKDIIFGPINMGINKNEAKEIAKRVIKEVGLTEEFLQKSPFELSGGQKRRVALAGILATMPDYLVFDEPTAGIDPAGAKDLLNLFREIHKNNKTIIIVTHNLDDVLEYTDRTIVLKEGNVIRDDKTIKVLSDIKFLKNNELEPPKLINIIDKINKKHNTNLKNIKSINELANEINKIKKGK